MNWTYKSISLIAFLSLAITTVSVKSASHERQPQFLPQTPAPIQLTVTVTNKNGFVTGLNQNNFQISVDKLPARIVHFSNQDSPVSVGIVFDASGSTQRLGSEKGKQRNLSLVQQALARFLELSNKSNEYFLIGFSEQPQLLADWTSDATLIVEKLGGLKPWGNTALYDTCHVGIEKLQQGRHPRRALIVISDGQDNSSRYSFTNLRELIMETDILLYSITFPQSVSAGTPFSREGQAILYELSSPTGGVSYVAANFKQRDANEIFEAIATELRSQYAIVIEPVNLDNNKKWHKIRLKVYSPDESRPEMKHLSARTREGYYWK